MSKQLKLTPQDAREAVYGDHEDFDVVVNELVETTRWSVCYEAVLKHKPYGVHYLVNYRRGATEGQDESPFEHDDEVILRECEARTVKRVEWSVKK